LVPSLFFLAAGLSCILIWGKAEIHLAINSWHHPVQDRLFSAWTWLGEGWFLAGLSMLLFLLKFRVALTALASYLIAGLAAQVLKRLVFMDMPRPVKFFELKGGGEMLYLVPGLDIHMWKSFPSGHTAAAFGVFFGLSLFLHSRISQFLLFAAALGVAYSRIYLSQHFLADTLGGAAIGLMGGYAAWRWIGNAKWNWLDHSMLAKRKA